MKELNLKYKAHRIQLKIIELQYELEQHQKKCRHKMLKRNTVQIQGIMILHAISIGLITIVQFA